MPSVRRPILIVDDEPDMLHSLQNLLRMDFDVNLAGSGQEAMQILERKPIHIVMTDQQMPQMSGVQFLKQAKHEHPEAMRVIFTGYAEIRAVIDAINQGNVYRYVTKPWDPDQLLTLLREAGEQYDKIADRKQLMLDLRTHEEQCVRFTEQLKIECEGTSDPKRVAEITQLWETGRALLERLSKMLELPGAGQV